MATPAARMRIEVAADADRVSAHVPDIDGGSDGHRARAAQVSVIMCVSRGDRLALLRESVSSVLAQTHHEFVLRILVDGPVTADVRAYLEAPGDARVRVRFSETHGGRGAGLNQLIDEALRDGAGVLARMDADSVSHPERLERQLAFLDCHPEVAVLGAGCLELDEETGDAFVNVPATSDEPLKRDLVRQTPFVPTSVVFRSAVFAGGTRYRSGPSEDSHLWVDLARYGWVFANLPDPQVERRSSAALVHPGSSWHRATSELSVRGRTMFELCMITPRNVAWVGVSFVLTLLPRSLTRRAFRYLRPRGTRA